MLKCRQRLNGSRYLMVASEGRTLADEPVYRIEVLDDDGTCWDASFESLDVVGLVERMGWWVDQDERNGLDWLS